jgi:hypothetical protein
MAVPVVVRKKTVAQVRAEAREGVEGVLERQIEEEARGV